jgi:23S rRNA pseudouridine1911/1915/1917 synthase
MVRHAGQPSHASLGIVHRIDKETSGLVVFARTLTAKRALDQLFRSHTIERSYVAFVHGHFAHAQTIRSQLVEDRGDGLRGSLKDHGRPNHAVTDKKRPKEPLHPMEAKLAITHLTPIEPGERYSKIACQLETGRTHQIRIHLAESGHPLVGEKVYIRDFLRDGHKPIASPRMMLHASTLGFVHPITHQDMRFDSPLPADFAIK